VKDRIRIYDDRLAVLFAAVAVAPAVMLLGLGDLYVSNVFEAHVVIFEDHEVVALDDTFHHGSSNSSRARPLFLLLREVRHVDVGDAVQEFTSLGLAGVLVVIKAPSAWLIRGLSSSAVLRLLNNLSVGYAYMLRGSDGTDRPVEVERVIFEVEHAGQVSGSAVGVQDIFFCSVVLLSPPDVVDNISFFLLVDAGLHLEDDILRDVDSPALAAEMLLHVLELLL